MKKCKYCEGRYDTGEYVDLDGLCDDCYNDYEDGIIIKCDECKEYVHEDDTHRIHNDYCEECGNEYEYELEEAAHGQRQIERDYWRDVL